MTRWIGAGAPAWLRAFTLICGAIVAPSFAGIARADITVDQWGAIVLTGQQYQLWARGQLTGRAACVARGQDTQDDRTVNVCVCVTSQAIQRGDNYARVSAGPKVPCPDVCTTPVGKWRWFNGMTISIHANHSADNGLGATAVWSQSGTDVTLRWTPQGTTDTLQLMGGGRELFGTYGIKPGSPGTRASSTRQGGC